MVAADVPFFPFDHSFGTGHVLYLDLNQTERDIESGFVQGRYLVPVVKCLDSGSFRGAIRSNIVAIKCDAHVNNLLSIGTATCIIDRVDEVGGICQSSPYIVFLP